MPAKLEGGPVGFSIKRAVGNHLPVPSVAQKYGVGWIYGQLALLSDARDSA